MAVHSPSCVVVADACRARLLVQQASWPPFQCRPALVERLSLENLRQRQRVHEAAQRARSGICVSHNYHRCVSGEQDTAGFAEEVAEATAKLCEPIAHRRMILLAPPRLLGDLCAALRSFPDFVQGVVEQIERDRELTQLCATDLHDWLAAAQMLPPRLPVQRERPRA